MELLKYTEHLHSLRDAIKEDAEWYRLFVPLSEDIQSESTNCSLVLLDEVGAGMNPLEGAALGMSVLEFDEVNLKPTYRILGEYQVIADMELLKQEYQELLSEAENHLMISRELHEKLLVAKRKIMEHAMIKDLGKCEKYLRLLQQHDLFFTKKRKQRESAIQSLQPTLERKKTACTGNKNNR